jgi:hypothetical protein
MSEGRLRPGNSRDTGDRVKLHRRVVRLDGRAYTVVTLRPGTRARFSTNRYHETWHVLSDQHGAMLLARLLWGLSYQRKPGTLVLIDRSFLDPNPFDAAPADPIVLACPPSTRFTGAVARDLRRMPVNGPPDGTVRWLSHGLDAEVARARARTQAIQRHEYSWDQDEWTPPIRTRLGRVSRINGVLALIGPPEVLRMWAVHVAQLGDWRYHGMDYAELDGTGAELCREDGEVQIFDDYRRRVSVATVARREVLAGPNARLAPAELEQVIWDHSTAVGARSG